MLTVSPNHVLKVLISGPTVSESTQRLLSFLLRPLGVAHESVFLKNTPKPVLMQEGPHPLHERCGLRTWRTIRKV